MGSWFDVLGSVRRSSFVVTFGVPFDVPFGVPFDVRSALQGCCTRVDSEQMVSGFASTKVGAIRGDGISRGGACRDGMTLESAGSRRATARVRTEAVFPAREGGGRGDRHVCSHTSSASPMRELADTSGRLLARCVVVDDGIMAETRRIGGFLVDFQPMSPEEMQRAMQFLLSQQAQFAADIARNEARMTEGFTRLNDGLVGLTAIVGQLAAAQLRTDEQLGCLRRSAWTRSGSVWTTWDSSSRPSSRT